MPAAALAASSYAENCAPCHGQTGAGDGPVAAQLPAPPPKFNDPATVWSRSPAEYFHIVKYGRIQKLMPPWGNQLSDDEIWQVLYYAWSLHTNQVTVEAGQQRYAASCANCHGDTGKGDGAQAPPDLADLSDSASMMIRTQAELDGNWRSAHGDVGGEWAPADRLAVLDYVRTFSYIPPWRSGYVPGDGVATGLVRQGTAGGDEVGSLPVDLTVFANFEPITTVSTLADPGGRFTFTDLSLTLGMQYVAATTYRDVQYNAIPFTLNPTTPTLELDLPVYEPTDSSSGLRIPRANMVVDFEPGQLVLGQILNLNNQSDRTFVGQAVTGLANPATIELRLPTDATDITFRDGVLGGRYQQAGDSVYDTVPFAPGENIIFVSYRQPVSEATMTITPQFAYTVTQVNLLVAELPGLQVQVPGLQQTSNEEIEGRQYQLWVGAMPANGLQIALNGVLSSDSSDPRASNEASVDNAAAATTDIVQRTVDPRIAWGLGGTMALLLGAALILPLRKRPANPVQGLQQERDELIKRIAELDDLHAIEQIEKASWSQRRAQLKSRLIDVVRELQVKEETKKVTSQ